MTTLGFTQTEFIAGLMLLFLALFSLVSTVTTLYLIYDMKRRNGYLLLIFNLTICQFFYDLPFFMLPWYNYRITLDITNFMFTFAGLAVALWTNVISLVLYNIVQYLHSFDIYGHYLQFASMVFVPSLLLACLMVAYFKDEDTIQVLNQIYYWTRIGSILFNVAIHGLISLKLHRMGYAAGGTAATEDPVRVLASRIKYYPIVQIVTRAGAAWYEFAYGFETDSYSQHMSATQQVSLYFYASCVPSAGIGYFLVFLIVQPAAFLHLKTKLRAAVRKVRRLLCCAEDDGRLSREDSNFAGGETTTYSESTIGNDRAPSRSSQRLLVGMCDMDEDELSVQIDQRYLTRSGDTQGSSGAAGSSLSITSMSITSRNSSGLTREGSRHSNGLNRDRTHSVTNL